MLYCTTMELHEITEPAFPIDAQSPGISKIEYVASIIYAQGEYDVYESAKAAVRLLQACRDIVKGMEDKARQAT